MLSLQALMAYRCKRKVGNREGLSKDEVLMTHYYQGRKADCKAITKKRFFSSGQGTVEYAVVFAGFLALVVALGILWRFMSEGGVIEHALLSASHHLQGLGGVLADVFIY